MSDQPLEILHLRNPEALNLPDIDALVNRAFASVQDPRLIRMFPKTVGLPHIDVLLPRIDGEWKGLAWVSHDSDPDVKRSTVVHFYCRSGKGVREAMVEEIVKGAREVGSESVLAWDMNRKPRAFQRLFKSAGPSKEVIRAYEFDISEARY